MAVKEGRRIRHTIVETPATTGKSTKNLTTSLRKSRRMLRLGACYLIESNFCLSQLPEFSLAEFPHFHS